MWLADRKIWAPSSCHALSFILFSHVKVLSLMRILILSLVPVLFWKCFSCASCPTLLPLSFFLFLLWDCLPRPDRFHLCPVNQSLPVYLSLFARLSHPFVSCPQVTQCAFLPTFLPFMLDLFLDYCLCSWILLDCLDWQPGFDPPACCWTVSFDCFDQIIARFYCFQGFFCIHMPHEC